MNIARSNCSRVHDWQYKVVRTWEVISQHVHVRASHTPLKIQNSRTPSISTKLERKVVDFLLISIIAMKISRYFVVM